MPRSAPKPCNHAGCPKLTHKGSYCETHAPQHKHNWGDDRQRGTAADRGYDYQWTKTRKVILRRDNYLCQPCVRQDKATPAQAVDHIISKENGGTDEHSNLQAICDACHAIKTRREQQH